MIPGNRPCPGHPVRRSSAPKERGLHEKEPLGNITASYTRRGGLSVALLIVVRSRNIQVGDEIGCQLG